MKVLRTICLAVLPFAMFAAGFSAVGSGTAGATAPSVTVASIVPSPNQANDTNLLNGISCSSVSSCMAVGAHYDGSSADETLIESWDGANWSIVTSPNQGSDDNILYGVSCFSPTFCTAVGQFYDGNLSQTLIESWDGANWSIVANTPNQSAGDNVLNAVSCSSATSCTAVGNYYDASASTPKTLIESWNGGSWSIVPSPSPGSSNNDLSGVSCTSSSNCTAVGYFTNSTNNTLVESWNGLEWVVVSSPNLGNGANELSGVSCSSPTSCNAVGDYDNTSAGNYETLAENWNGSQWVVVPSPSPSATSTNVLKGISCLSSSWCLAVGYDLQSNQFQTLIESWNGSEWSVIPNPSPTPDLGSSNVLEGVACASATSCSAAGYSFGGSTPNQTLIVAVQSSPFAPSGVAATPGNAKATVNWSASPGTVTSYTATATPGGASCTTATTSCVITGLTNGSTYSVTVTASNAVGTSDSSDPVSVTLPIPATLAATGSDLMNPPWLAIALFGLGGGALLVSRRRKTQPHS